MNRYLPAVTRALFDSDLVVSRVMLALAEWCWVVLLLWPGDTFNQPFYKLMERVMNEECWALLFIASGIIQLNIILTESFYTPFAKHFSAFSAGLWAYIVFAMLFSVQPPPAIAGEIALAFAAVWIWCRPYIILGGLARAYERPTRKVTV